MNLRGQHTVPIRNKIFILFIHFDSERALLYIYYGKPQIAG